jgi:hypothetical protein
VVAIGCLQFGNHRTARAVVKLAKG